MVMHKLQLSTTCTAATCKTKAPELEDQPELLCSSQRQESTKAGISSDQVLEVQNVDDRSTSITNARHAPDSSASIETSLHMTVTG